jgi:hypothetical protein
MVFTLAGLIADAGALGLAGADEQEELARLTWAGSGTSGSRSAAATHKQKTADQKRKKRVLREASAQMSAGAAQPGKPAKKRKQGSGSVEDGASWPFEVCYTDHFSTGALAVAHADAVLACLAQRVGRPKSSLVLYDPVSGWYVFLLPPAPSL